MGTFYGKDNLNFEEVKPMQEGTDVINVNEILGIYKEYCAEIGYAFDENCFKEFIKFLEVDFYDWVSGNLKYFEGFEIDKDISEDKVINNT